jgi:hypothetical protein
LCSSNLVRHWQLSYSYLLHQKGSLRCLASPVFASLLLLSVSVQYLVFEFVENTLLEVLESRRRGLEPEEVSWH